MLPGIGLGGGRERRGGRKGYMGNEREREEREKGRVALAEESE